MPWPIPLNEIFHIQRDNVQSVNKYSVKKWVITITKNNFTQNTRCVIRSSNVSYGNGVVTFSFGPSVDTYDAVYRIDNAPVVSWRIYIRKIILMGAQLQSESASNPSGGVVKIPVEALIGKTKVEVEPSPTTKPVTFDVSDLSQAIEGAGRAGCAADPALAGGEAQ